MSQSILVGSNREKEINPIKVLKFNKCKLYTFLKAVPPFCWLKKLLRLDKINNKLAPFRNRIYKYKCENSALIELLI